MCLVRFPERRRNIDALLDPVRQTEVITENNEQKQSFFSFSPPTFGFEGKVAVLANVRTDVGVRSNVLLQHARFFTANATFSTYVLAPAATSHVHVLFIGFVPGKKRDRY